MRKTPESGFTLIELLVVVLLIGILVTIAIPIYSSTQRKAKLRTCFANLRTMESAIEIYKVQNDSLPSSLSDLDGYTLKGLPKCPVDGGVYDATFDIAKGKYHVWCNRHPDPYKHICIRDTHGPE